MQWSVDVWHSTTFPVGPEPDDWRRYRIEAGHATEAELIACQMTAAHTGWTPVRSVVVEWEEQATGHSMVSQPSARYRSRQSEPSCVMKL